MHGKNLNVWDVMHTV